MTAIALIDISQTIASGIRTDGSMRPQNRNVDCLQAYSPKLDLPVLSALQSRKSQGEDKFLWLTDYSGTREY